MDCAVCHLTAFTAGGNFRGHPAYGLFPFNDWLQGSNGQWWTLAYEYGYDDEYWFDDLNDNGVQDPGEFGSYEWYNEDGELMIQVAKTQKYKEHHIDALAGATLTSNGVDNLVKFWMGKDGFKKFLNNLKNGSA